MMNEMEVQARVHAVVQKALTEMKCMVMRAQHMADDIADLQAHPTREMVEAFCRKHDRLQSA
jgi:hypothetical protein